MLKPKIGENARESLEEETEKKVSSFYTPTKYVRINSTQNDPCINADQCFQYVDELGTAANTFGEFVNKSKAIFVCTEKAGLKFAPGKSKFGLKETTFLGKPIPGKV